MIIIGLSLGMILSMVGLLQGLSAGLLALAVLALVPPSAELTTGLLGGLIGTSVWINAKRDKAGIKHVLIPIATTLVILSLLVTVNLITKTNIIDPLIALSKQIAWLGILIWFACHVNKSNWWIYLLYAAWGLLVFRLDATRGSTWAPMLLMLGFISVPTLIRPNIEPEAPSSNDNQVLIFGSLVGILSALFIGIGSSSVVNLVKQALDIEDKDTSLDTTAATNNSLVGFLLLLGYNSSRSAEASLAQVLDLDPLRTITTVFLGLVAGFIAYTYIPQVNQDNRLLKLIALASLSLVVFSGSPLIALAIVTGSAAISLINQNNNPKDSQPIFAALASSILLG